MDVLLKILFWFSVGLCFYKAYFFLAKDRISTSLLLILIAGFLLRVYCSTDEYLHEWDERYHALVAKNMLNHPLKPTLYDTPVLQYDFKDWSNNHVWLSKGPVPFSFMAASLKIFGTNEFALRIPSILFSTASIWLTFLIGAMLFGGRGGAMAAFFHAIHGLLLELAGGRVSSDHVETIFLFFFELAVFYTVKGLVEKNKIKGISLMIGTCIGLAFLCKWIVALLVLPIWLLVHLVQRREPFIEILKGGLLISLAFLLVVLPWILYIYHSFPSESKWLAESLFIPLNTAIQGHSGTCYFYIDRIRIMFGELIYLPLLWLIYQSFTKKDKSLSIVAIWIFVPLIFFSLAQTKRYTYIMVAAPAFFILTALFIRYIESYKPKLNAWGYKILIFLMFALPIRYSIERIKPFKISKSPIWIGELKRLPQEINSPPLRSLFFNEPHYIEAMFYTDFTFYPNVPEASLLKELKKDYHLYVKVDGKYQKM